MIKLPKLLIVSMLTMLSGNIDAMVGEHIDSSNRFDYKQPLSTWPKVSFINTAEEQQCYDLLWDSGKSLVENQNNIVDSFIAHCCDFTFSKINTRVEGIEKGKFSSGERILFVNKETVTLGADDLGRVQLRAQVYGKCRSMQVVHNDLILPNLGPINLTEERHNQIVQTIRSVAEDSVGCEILRTITATYLAHSIEASKIRFVPFYNKKYMYIYMEADTVGKCIARLKDNVKDDNTQINNTRKRSYTEHESEQHFHTPEKGKQSDQTDYAETVEQAKSAELLVHCVKKPRISVSMHNMQLVQQKELPGLLELQSVARVLHYDAQEIKRSKQTVKWVKKSNKDSNMKLVGKFGHTSERFILFSDRRLLFNIEGVSLRLVQNGRILVQKKPYERDLGLIHQLVFILYSSKRNSYQTDVIKARSKQQDKNSIEQNLYIYGNDMVYKVMYGMTSEGWNPINESTYYAHRYGWLRPTYRGASDRLLWNNVEYNQNDIYMYLNKLFNDYGDMDLYNYFLDTHSPIKFVEFGEGSYQYTHIKSRL